MNTLMFVAGIMFLMMGVAGFFYSPVIVHGFYDYTGLSNLSIYQNEDAISGVIGGYRLAGLISLVAGVGFVIGSRLD